MIRSTFAARRRAVLAAGLALGAVLAPLAARAETAADFLDRFTAEARRAQPQFAPSAERGGAFYARDHGVSKELPSCSSCHTDRPVAEGRHKVTGKRIAPLSPSVNAERFSEASKVERWFRRNCTEVIGRDCTPAEKADFIAFVREQR